MAADRRVLAEHEHAADDAVARSQCHRQLRMVADNSRQPGKAEIAVRSGGIAKIRLQQADGEFWEVVPPSEMPCAA